MNPTILPPGVHLDIPAEVYHAQPGASASILRIIHTSSPLHANAAMDEPFEETPAMRLGTLAHHVILEPDRPLPRIAVTPSHYPCPPDSSLVKTKKAAPGELVPWHPAASYCKAWRASNEATGDLVLSQKEYDAAASMAQAIARHPIARTLLAKGRPEVSVISHDDGLNVPIRCRIDWLPEGDATILLDNGIEIPVSECVVDIKTTTDASPFGFSRQVSKMAYHLQAAWYLDLLASEGIPRPYFAFIAVESSSPHDVVVHVCEERTIAAGRDAYIRALTQWEKCRRQGVWPGAAPSTATLLRLPEWAIKDA